MKNFFLGLIFTLVIVGIFFVFKLLISQGDFQLLNPQGSIAKQERDLMYILVGLMLIIVVPALVAWHFVAWKYREGNKKAKYTPDAKSSVFSEVLIWVIPTLIVIVMSIYTVEATFRLDPYKKIESDVKPVTIQVVALQYKWLFIYPEQKIATVNFVEFPAHTPISFELTADAPMNSFWIPKLSGQMYAMTGMVTPHHIIADEPGDYHGSPAEISGHGFATMRFVARATATKEEFDKWAEEIKNSSRALDVTEYDKLAKPSEKVPPMFYRLADEQLYDKIVMKFMSPARNASHSDAGGPPSH